MTTENEQQTTEVEVLAESQETETPPSQEPEETSVESGGFEEPDFGALTDFVEDDVEETPEETPVETPPVEAEAEATETPAEETPPEETAEPAESESEETSEEAEAAAEETEEETTEEPPEPVKLPTKEELEGMYADHREKTLPIFEEHFTLSDEEAAALDEKPSEVLPKMAARLQYDVMLSTYNAVMAAMPSVMGTLMHTTNLANQAHAQFMDAWPDLNNKKSEGAVKAAIQAYRSANPRATLEDTIKNAGVMAMINLGLDPTKAGKPAAKPAPKPTPPKPAAPTGQSPTPPVVETEDDNVFSQLAAVFEQDQS